MIPMGAAFTTFVRMSEGVRLEFVASQVTMTMSTFSTMPLWFCGVASLRGPTSLID